MIPAPRSSRPRQLNRVGGLVVSLVITAGGSDRAVQAEARTSAAPPPVPDAAALKRLAARLAPAELSADVTKLPASERSALIAILRAARLMDGLFMQQVWAG